MSAAPAPLESRSVESEPAASAREGPRPLAGRPRIAHHPPAPEAPLRRTLLLSLVVATACAKRPVPRRSTDLPPEAVARLVREDVTDKRGWGADVHAALRQAGQPVTVDTACQVLAVIEQESGYEADPAVPNLGRVVQGELDEAFAKLGPAAAPVRKKLLDPVAPGATASFDTRLGQVRTEQQADRLYREIVSYHLAQHPLLSRAMDLLAPDFVEAHNPVTTAGSMQVSVGWAIEQGAAADIEPEVVRDLLYTRAGGVRFGTARLFAHDAPYADPRHRFADFNAGVWASRNAAIQAQVSNLTGIDIALDGDFLRYDKDGSPSARGSNTQRVVLVFREQQRPDISDRQVRRDLREEKTAGFDDTVTVRAIRQAWEQKHGLDAAYAWMPMVELHSPKMKSGRTTKWFADNVKRRYDACLQRGR